MRWTPEERNRHLGRGGQTSTPPAVFVAALVSLALMLAGAKFGLGIRIPGLETHRHAGPIGCVGPSTIPCPPGTVRMRDPHDPNNPNVWPNDLHRSPMPPSV